jgi:hypothetical protein
MINDLAAQQLNKHVYAPRCSAQRGRCAVAVEGKLFAGAGLRAEAIRSLASCLRSLNKSLRERLA